VLDWSLVNHIARGILRHVNMIVMTC
jgi:hypothetical protein